MLLLERSCDLSTKVNSAVLFLFSVFSYLSHLGVLVLDLSFVILFEKPSKNIFARCMNFSEPRPLGLGKSFKERKN